MMITLGIVGDTHVPDRIRSVPTAAFEILRAANVVAILHTGDLSHPRVLDAFAAIAPVHAVRGNRDIWHRAGRALPLQRILEFEGVGIGLTHGHGGLAGYVREKIVYYTMGFSNDRVIRNVAAWFPAGDGTDVVVFGHTHRPMLRIVGERLFLNPGSLGPDYYTGRGPTLALLRLDDGEANAEIVPVPAGV